MSATNVRSAQIVEVEQQQAAIVSQLEGNLEGTHLWRAELQDARKQCRTQLARCRPHRVTRRSIQVPEHHRVRLGGITFDPDLGDALLNFLASFSGHRKAGDVALDVGQKHRHAKAREPFSQHHQRNCFSGAGGPGNEPVAVSVLRVEINGLFALSEQDA